MKKPKSLHLADLFCGAGGTSSGLVEAMGILGHKVHLTAINHWDVAVATHTVNHPDARHLCTSIDDVNPRNLYKPGQLHLLWASPECMNHSRARGGRPINDQSRATAHCVTRWAEALQPNIILVENVPEFLEWGPLTTKGKPMASRKGSTFKAWVSMLQSLGYRVDWRILRAADYGDPTTRRRLFVQAVRGRRAITWPDATHDQDPASCLFPRAPWRAAREIIDWSLEGESIFTRKRPLAPRTLQRIEAGLRKFCGIPFILQVSHGSGTQCRIHELGKPLGVVPTHGKHALAQPFLLELDHQTRGTGGNTTQHPNAPLSSVTTKARHCLVQPCLLPQQSGGQLRPVDQPAPTVSTAGAISLVEPYLVELRNTSHSRALSQPLSTVTSSGAHHALVEPFLIQYYSSGSGEQPHSLDKPLDTVTTKERHGLVQPIIKAADGKCYLLDIRFRMLQPNELALAQGFPATYQFTGTKTQITKQIGNAVPRRLSRALALAAFTGHTDITPWLPPEDLPQPAQTAAAA